jgi:hypothetical protein
MGATRADADAALPQGGMKRTLYHTVAVTALFNFMNRRRAWRAAGQGAEAKTEALRVDTSAADHR